MSAALLVVLWKELLDGLRDRRALASALLFPLLGPVLIGFMLTRIAQDEDTRGPLVLPVDGAAHAPALLDFLRGAGVEVVPPPDDPETAVRSGAVDVVLRIEPTYAEDWSAGRPAPVSLIVDASRSAARTDTERARALLGAYAGQAATLRLLARGVSPALAQPLSIDEVDLATPESRGARLLEMAVMFVVMAAFLCSLYLAIDATAGERERKSLEPLLLTPAPRTALAAGKFLAATLFGLVGTALTLAAVVLVLRQVPLELLGVRAALDARAALLLFAVCAPLAPFAAATQLLIAAFARSFKEAQTWLGATLILPMLPGLVLSLNPARPGSALRAVPVLGQQLLAGEVFRGEALPAGPFVACAASTLLVSLVAFAALVRVLRNEEALGRGG